jgi:hypothetical protein
VPIKNCLTSYDAAKISSSKKLSSKTSKHDQKHQHNLLDSNQINSKSTICSSSDLSNYDRIMVNILLV